RAAAVPAGGVGLRFFADRGADRARRHADPRLACEWRVAPQRPAARAAGPPGSASCRALTRLPNHPTEDYRHAQLRFACLRDRCRGRPDTRGPCAARQVRPLGLVRAACAAGCHWPGTADRDAGAGFGAAAGAGRFRAAADRGAGRLLPGLVPLAPETAAQGGGAGACERRGGRLPDPAQPAGVTVMRHPLHPALVHFPVACWSLAVAADFASLHFGPAAWPWSSGPLTVGCVMALLALALFATRLLLRLDHLQPLVPDTLSLLLDAGGFLALAVGGWLGGRLVYGHGVGRD